MDATEDNIQLPVELPEDKPEHPDVLELVEQCSANSFPAINTDNLPITPNKKWINSATLSPQSPQSKISLNIAHLSKSPTKLHENEKATFFEDLGSSCKELNNINLPNTDNLLDINVPKTAVLGKEQAKKRLHAFSLAKQNSLSASPLLKKNIRQPKFLLQPAEDKYNENGEKTDEKFILIKKPARKCANPNEKAKAVIEEIEEIKKIESAYLEALEQGLLDNRHRKSRSRSKSRERSQRHSKKNHKRSRSVDNSKSRKSYEKFKYPRNWTEFKASGCNFETLNEMKSKDYRNKDDNLSDFRKQFLFKTPSHPLHRLTIKCANGKEKIIPAECIRFTSATPKVSYSTTDKVSNDYLTRKCVLDYVPRSVREIMRKIVDHSTSPSDSNSPTKVTTRKWFPKTVLSKLENQTECTILEASLGLSFLQNYSDEDEQEKEDINKSSEDKEADVVMEDYNNTKEELSKTVIEEPHDQEISKKEECDGASKSAKSEPNRKVELKVKSESEIEAEEKTIKHKKAKKKRKKKEKRKCHSKVKKEKYKKKKNKSGKKADKTEKDKVERKSSITDDEAKKRTDKRKKCDNKKVDGKKTKTENREPKKATRKRSTSNDTKEHKNRRNSRDESSDKVKKSKKKMNDDNDKSGEKFSKDVLNPSKSEKEFDNASTKEVSLKKESSRHDNSAKTKHEKEQIDHSAKTKNEKEQLDNSAKNKHEKEQIDHSAKNKHDKEQIDHSAKNKNEKEQIDNSAKNKHEKEQIDNHLKEKQGNSRRRSTEKTKEGRHRSKSQEKKPKKKAKGDKTKSSKNEKETRKVKCVAEKEFGTPDTEEYYSNWESDVELNANLLKPSDESFNQSTGINRSWESDDEPLDVSHVTNNDNYLDIPLTKSPFRNDKSPPRSLLNKDRSVDPILRDKRYKKDKSPERSRTSERRPSLRDRSLERSPVRARLSDKSSTRTRHLDNFPDEISPNLKEFSPGRNRFSPVRNEFLPVQNKFCSPMRNEFSVVHSDFSPGRNKFSPVRSGFSPVRPDFSPFRNRCIDERRRSRRSLERSPPPRTSPEPFLEMPLNIRNTRKGYLRNKWEEERFESSKYSRSPEREEFNLRMSNEKKVYALYAEDSWERDDYLTEEMRLKEERRTLIEERRQLEIEKRKLEELNRQRFYSHSSEIDDQRCSLEKRHPEQFNSDEDEDRYSRAHRNYREARQLQTYSKEGDTVLPRRSIEDQRVRRRYSSDRSQEKNEIQRERARDSFGWEDCVETKRPEKYFERPPEQDANKDRATSRRRKSRWQNIDDNEEPTPEQYVRAEEKQISHIKNEHFNASNRIERKSAEKEKKALKKNRWESSEDELQTKDDKKLVGKEIAVKVQSKQDFVKKAKDIKTIKQKHKTEREHSPAISKERRKHGCKKEKELGTDPPASLTDNLDLPPRRTADSRTPQIAQKPEMLENEYEKFMQALGSEDISERDNQQNKYKMSTSSKPSTRKMEKRKIPRRSITISSDEELERTSKNKTMKRRSKKKVSSSSSSSTSSSSSDSDSSSGSSSATSSSESSSSLERRRKIKKRKLNVVTIKSEKEEMQDKGVKLARTVTNDLNVINSSDIAEKEAKVIIKIEETEMDLPHPTETAISAELLSSKSILLSPSKTVNIINISVPDFSLGEIPLPNSETQKTVIRTSFTEIPLPVPSPKLDAIATIIDPFIPKVEPVMPIGNPPLPRNDSLTVKTDLVTPTVAPVVPEIIPVSPVTPVTTVSVASQFIPNSPTFAESEMVDINTLIDLHVDIKKEEPAVQDDSKAVMSQAQLDALASPTKRSNIIPIKFLTAELRKQANESPHLKAVGLIESKNNLPTNSQNTVPELKTNSAEKSDATQLPLTNRSRHFAISSMNLPATLPAFDESDHGENSNSADFTERFVRKEKRGDRAEEVSTSVLPITEQFVDGEELKHDQTLHHHTPKSHSSPKADIQERYGEQGKRSRSSSDHSKERPKRRSRSISPGRKHDASPRSTKRGRSPWRHDSPRRHGKDTSPRRKERKMSPRSLRNISPRRWDHDGSPRRGNRDLSSRRSRDDSFRRNSSTSPKRYSISPRRKDLKRDRRSLSPRNSEMKRRSLSPRQRSPPSRRRSASREFSPKRRHSRDRSHSKERKIESIQETLQRIAGVSKYSSLSKHSPLGSPLHGFKRSVADSTISDDQLLQRNLEEYTRSPSYNVEYYKNPTSIKSPSPRRMSLDERISQALGLAEQPKPISTTYSNNYEYDQQYFEQYGQYFEQYNENQKSDGYDQPSQAYRPIRQRENSNLKVVQVGNVLQVVPTEDATQKGPPLQQNQVTNSTQKIVQVGNMLQIVPNATLPEKPLTPVLPPSIPLPPAAAPPPSPSASTPKDTLNAEALIKQKAERRAEKDKRRQERDRKRKEKEKKRKERERRKQIKLKLQTEAMIKQALILDTEETRRSEEDVCNAEPTTEPLAHMQWPPVPQIVCNSSYKPAGKSILCQGFRSSSGKGEEGESDAYQERRKSVKFSDGVVPGEGTSPSGGEELSSPPPAPRKLPKEKRFKKTKIPKKVKVPKKKKVKVKVIRQQQTQGPEDDDEEEDDNLPPPPPPPGSPPPHLFPARIKQPVINNIHPNIVASVVNATLPPTDTSYPPPPVYRPVMMPHHHGHHHGPPHLPPHHGHHHLPPPCPPPHHGGFNPPPVVIPPVITVVPSMPSFGPPPSTHHQWHGGHHHHQHHHSPHHNHHHH